ncbi:MAG: slipin family protein [Spirochaetaceae bacterium]|nr:slipin family protein [Spirochaetaceae bacterium]
MNTARTCGRNGAKARQRNLHGGITSGGELVKHRPHKKRRDDWGFSAPGWTLILTAAIGETAAVIFPALTAALTAPCVILAAAGVLVSFVRKAQEWERAVVLRFGKFHKVKGPGLFIRIPFVDKIAEKIDIRIRVTDFSAQETLTMDSVTVTVDAVCFWHIWDPEKALLEVENYEDAVVLSSKTALRNAVSSHDLSTFLEHGEVIEKQIQHDVDRKTADWGITIHHIEITDVQIPAELQDSLSRTAQAEREKKGRVLLANAEIEIAKLLKEAVEVYAHSESALRLKILSILNEGLKAGNSMMLVPAAITEALAANLTDAPANTDKYHNLI